MINKYIIIVGVLAIIIVASVSSGIKVPTVGDNIQNPENTIKDDSNLTVNDVIVNDIITKDNNQTDNLKTDNSDYKSCGTGTSWGCRSITQGEYPGESISVCGCISTCSSGLHLITSGAGVGEIWPDGSKKGIFECSKEYPPSEGSN